MAGISRGWAAVVRKSRIGGIIYNTVGIGKK